LNEKHPPRVKAFASVKKAATNRGNKKKSATHVVPCQNRGRGGREGVPLVKELPWREPTKNEGPSCVERPRRTRRVPAGERCFGSLGEETKTDTNKRRRRAKGRDVNVRGTVTKMDQGRRKPDALQGGPPPRPTQLQRRRNLLTNPAYRKKKRAMIGRSAQEAGMKLRC